MGDLSEFDSNMSFEEFLKSRNIPQQTLSKIEDEKINSATILMMPEEDLKLYFPKYGDRAAITNFCRRHNNSNKQSLIEKLKVKIGGKPYTKKENKFEKKKKTRIIEIGWLCFNKGENRYRQVRTKYGGGTRKVNVDKDSKCEEILKLGKTLFFPDEISTKGRLSSYNCELLDFKSHTVALDLTVQDMYNISSLSTLRFYLATTLKDDQTEDIADETELFVPATVTQPSPSSSTSDRVLRSSTSIHRNSHIVDYINSFNSDYQDLGIFEVENDYYASLEDCTNQSEHLDTVVNTKKMPKLILHRGSVFKDMLDAFQEEFFDNGELQVEMILPNGESEKAEDLGGVLRDAFSEFFDTFYETCTIGTSLKVPYVRHDYGEKQWEAIAKILERAWTIGKYFPIKLAPVFVKGILGFLVSDDELIENFFQYVCESDSNMLKLALNNFALVEQDDMVEFFSNYESKWLPNKDNIKQLTIDIAHKELVQKPAFIAKCFIRLKNTLTNFSTDIYQKMKPTEKNILNNFVLLENDLTTEMAATYSFLKKYIKESDIKTRESFLRFCTGSNIVSEKINISFNKSQGFTRSPTSHTCSCSLEIPTTYESFVVFRNEFNNLLTSKIWVMDMV